ncbi:MAG: hypothetical protein LC776_16555, partial [Acidobacteria bacterium]|nr:hypothetical protein [Acidobacteriota bacterium]
RATYAPSVLNQTPYHHPLEPYGMSLLINRTDYRVPTAEIRSDAPLAFRLPSGGARVLRLDLLFATHGGPGAPVRVTLRAPDTETPLACATASAPEIADDVWTAFHLQLEKDVESFDVQVERLPEQDSDAAGVGGKSKIALWAEREGSHSGGGRLLFGAPCVRLWVQEELPASLPSMDVERPSFLVKLKSRARLAYYLWRVKGTTVLTQTMAAFFLRRARTTGLLRRLERRLQKSGA